MPSRRVPGKTLSVKVLVVDDSNAIRERLVAMLKELPFVRDVWEASDGGSALELVRERGPAVVVLDVRMPGGASGLDVLPQMKAANGATVIIVLTNHPTEHHRQQAKALGADHFFDKSGDFQRVCDVVRALAERRDRPE
jgi:CheY-like chemotaxis protein